MWKSGMSFSKDALEVRTVKHLFAKFVGPKRNPAAKGRYRHRGVLAATATIMGFAVLLTAGTTLGTSPNSGGSGFVVNGIHIPDQLAGHPVLGVADPAVDPCIVVPRIEVSTGLVREPGGPPGPSAAAIEALGRIQDELTKLGVDVHKVNISFGPGTADAARAQIQDEIAFHRKHGCGPTLGPGWSKVVSQRASSGADPAGVVAFQDTD